MPVFLWLNYYVIQAIDTVQVPYNGRIGIESPITDHLDEIKMSNEPYQ